MLPTVTLLDVMPVVDAFAAVLKGAGALQAGPVEVTADATGWRPGTVRLSAVAPRQVAATT
jgi:hypothetical protein